MILLQGFGDQIIAGAITTLQVALTSLVLGIAVGLCGAMAKVSGIGALRWLADGYTTIVRGIPELLIILILYFGGTVALTALFGRYVEVDAFAAGVIYALLWQLPADQTIAFYFTYFLIGSLLSSVVGFTILRLTTAHPDEECEEPGSEEAEA